MFGCYWKHRETLEVVLETGVSWPAPRIKEGLSFPFHKISRYTHVLTTGMPELAGDRVNRFTARIYSRTFSVASAEHLALDSSMHNWKADLLL